MYDPLQSAIIQHGVPAVTVPLFTAFQFRQAIWATRFGPVVDDGVEDTREAHNEDSTR